ncbi:MAG TPA: tetratricopeptide repeat protein [Candidatus Acidoferrales bacterium]|nr:tetratricopeptide repeat protein [Candidatus Acidoferrales bacterium]
MWRGAITLLCACALATALAPAMWAQDASGAPGGISVQVSEQIFDTLCALDAAGFNADASTLGDMPERLALRTELLKMQGPATLAVRAYYHGHPIADPSALLSRYITFALVLGPPPDFTFQVSEDEMPPDALSLRDFQPLLSAFYKEANLGPRWQKVEPEYQTLAGGYRSIVRATVVKTNAYLREVIGSGRGRSFTVYVDPLAGSSTNFRNLGDQYAVVVGGRPTQSAGLIQHAYLHFMLDPLVLKDRDNLQSKSAILNIAAHAPQLPDEYKTDFVSYVDECVVKAVELRLRDLSDSEQEKVLQQDDESGFVMVRPLMVGLHKFEKDNPSMTYYFPDLISGIDVAAEQKRLQGITFASAQPAPAAPTSTQTADAAKQAMLAQGDREIALHDAAAAAEIFTKVLDAYPNDPHALYGLAVASVLSGHADESKQLFEKVVASSSPGGNAANQPDPTVLAWSHIYLGRMDDLEGSRDVAVKEYRAALSVAGAPESARVVAQGGVDHAYAVPKRDGEGGSQ